MGMVCSAALAAAMVSCSDTPTQSGDTPSANVAAASDSVQLTYICGNMFRIRNRSFEPRQVRWGTYNVPSDTGSLRLRGRDVGAAQVDYFVTAQTKGTMRLFVGTRLVDTKANGNKAACAEPVDTSGFPMVRLVAGARPELEPQYVLPDGTVSTRSMIVLRFRPASSNAQRRDFQRRFGAQLVRASRLYHTFRVVPTDSTSSSMDALDAAISAHPAVQGMAFLKTLDRVTFDGARYPNDGGGLKRADYLAGAASTWVANHLRLPQAWWCENGAYGANKPVLAVYETNVAPLPADLTTAIDSGVTTFTIPANLVTTPAPPAALAFVEDHGLFVASMLAAVGDNNSGTTGVLWKADLRIFSGDARGNLGWAISEFNATQVASILRASPRVLSLSSDFRYPDTTRVGTLADTVALGHAVESMRTLLDSLPGLLIVKAAGNDYHASNYSLLSEGRRALLLDALIALKDSGYASRIILVGSSTKSATRSSFSNSQPGKLDIYAPGENVPGLDRNGGVRLDSGTSFATPIVAGIAGMLLSADPSLSAADVKDLLLRGARDSVEMSNGTDSLPRPIDAGVYEADAFGSLRLLASRAGTPLCGARIVPLVDRDTALRRVLVYRYQNATPEAITFRASGSNTFMRVSPAPGGRSFSVDADTARIASLTSSGWSIGTLAGFSTVRFGERDTILAIRTPTVCSACESVTLARADSGRRNTWSSERVHGPSLALSPDGNAIGWIDSSQVHVRRIGRPSIDVQGHWYAVRQQRSWTIVRASAFSHDGTQLALGVTRAECPPFGGGGPPDDGILLSVRGRGRVRAARERAALDIYVPGVGAENCEAAAGVAVWDELVNRSWIEDYELSPSSSAATQHVRPSELGYISWLDASDGGHRWEFKRTESVVTCALVADRRTTLSRLFERSLPYGECDPVRKWWNVY
jgi:hypothetical protein